MEAGGPNRDRLIEGLSRITGISRDLITAYAMKSDVLHVIDHPTVIPMTDEQYGKILELKGFLNAYQTLRRSEGQGKKELTGPDCAKGYFISQLAYYRERESILCAFLNAKMEVLACEQVSQGTVDCSCIFPREIVKRVIQLDATGILLAHNHPGNSLAPSRADLAMTQLLCSILDPLGVKLLDHIIIGGDQAISMSEIRMLPEGRRKVSQKEYDSFTFRYASEGMGEGDGHDEGR